MKKFHFAPRLQILEELDDVSLRLMSRDDDVDAADRVWHYHPEVELISIKQGSGMRYVGNHISNFVNGDLILIGPNLPHLGVQNGLGYASEFSLQFRPSLFQNLVKLAPEMRQIHALIEKARSGMAYHGETKRIAELELELLERKSPFDRIISVLNLLQLLAQSDECILLNPDGYDMIRQDKASTRLNQIYSFVKMNYARHIALSEISAMANMAVPAFCRFFKKSTNRTFTQFVNEYRIRQSISMISDDRLAMKDIAKLNGFKNYAHFVKHFKQVTNHTPSRYKSLLTMDVAGN